jgi:23S rRNA pseudouridine955/2504/2580 synthase
MVDFSLGFGYNAPKKAEGVHAMREFIIGKNDAGQRVDRFLSKAMPLLPGALLQKYIRIKRVKCNGARCQRDQRLAEGDVLQVYINDEFFEQPREDNLFLTLFQPKLEILYEDENILLTDKRPGMVVHADETEKVNTLINHIQAYLYQKREWNPKWENAFAPALCNRIDRNTGGIVIAAKNAETLRILTAKIRDREITKKYLCVALGVMNPPEGRLECFLLKDEGKKQVTVYHRPVPGGKSAVTLYRTVRRQGALSLVEAELLTGRTHQIRASFADAGHPLLGDGKYGKGDINRKYSETKQALYSYYIKFDFPTDAGILEYLRGRVFQIKKVPFVEKYFGKGIAE